MKTETINFTTSKGATTAIVARPDEQASAAAILIHEWWGINDHIRDLAGRYAKEGYLCVAPDLFRGKVTKDPEEASRLMHDLETADGLETISQAIKKTRGELGVQRIGISGYCMGGTFLRGYPGRESTHQTESADYLLCWYARQVDQS
jgi:carboxymethylenebutenolidase